MPFKNPEDERAYRRKRYAEHESVKESQRRRSQKWRENNAAAISARSQAWAKANPEKMQGIRSKYLRKKLYGLSPEQVTALYTAQGGACAICYVALENERAAHIDHCHATGHVRGMLCIRCNRSLGLMRDDAEALERAASYLRGCLQTTP